jgi:hypothetical protein
MGDIKQWSSRHYRHRRCYRCLRRRSLSNVENKNNEVKDKMLIMEL